VVQASESRPNGDATTGRVRNPATGSALVEAEVSAVIVIIMDVLGKESLQMALVPSDDMIEQVAPTASHPALSNSILPGTLDGGSYASDLHGPNGSRDFQPIFLIVIQEQELGSGLIGKCFTQLLDDPSAGRMAGDIAVQDPATVMTNNEEAVEQLKRDRRNSKEIHGGDGFSVIAEKRKPTLGRFRISGCAPHPAGDGALGYVKAQHAQFAMNARRTPDRVLSNHLEDQFADLFGNPFPAANSLSHFAKHGPIESESSPVPADHRFREDHKECLFPLSPE